MSNLNMLLLALFYALGAAGIGAACGYASGIRRGEENRNIHPDLKTMAEWEEVFELYIVDPDGFNRKDPYVMERLYTRDEFQAGVLTSTIMPTGQRPTPRRTPGKTR